MSSSKLFSIASAAFYTIFAFSVLVLSLLAITYVFTTIRYRISLRNNQNGADKTYTPVKIPYYLPFLGNAPDFLTPRPGAFWSRLFKWHPRATGACTLKMGGRNMHVLYHPRAVQALLKAREPTRDNANLDIVVKGFGIELDQGLAYYGLTEGVSEMFGRTPRAEQERINHDYLLKTERVNELTSEFTRLLQGELSSELQGDEKFIEIGLYSWLRNRMFKASTNAFFGRTCLEDCPDLEKDFFDFDVNFLTCYFGIPRWMAPKVYALRERITLKMTRWQEKNWERNQGEVVDAESDTVWEPIQGSRLNRARQTYYAHRGLTLRSRAILDLGMMFGISSNAIPATGWMLMHILDPKGDKTLYPRIMEEVRASQREDGSIDVATLVNQPLLLSMLHEVLRLYVDTLVTRELPKDLIVPIGDADGKFLLSKDSIVLAPSWLGHRDDNLWSSPAANVFHAERFLTTDTETGKQLFSTTGTSGRLFPFGGGKTICPGRVFAKQEVLGSVAMILSELDFEGLGYIDKQGRERDTFPTLNDAYPGSAIMVMEGDLKVRIKRRF